MADERDLMMDLVICDREGDEVDIACAGSALWLAWSSASLEAEVVRAIEVGKPEASAHTLAGPAFRPRLAAWGDTVWLAACIRDGRRSLPGGLVITPRGSSPWAIPEAAACFGVAVAAAGDAAWIAWEDRALGRITLARIDCRGQIFGQRALPGQAGQRSPSLAVTATGEVIAAWAEAGRIAFCRVTPDGEPGPVSHVAGHGAHQDAPAVCALGDGSAAVAWHSRARGDGSDVVAWLGVATVAGDGTVSDMSPAPRDVAAQASSDIDQGWELPALAEALGGGLWLAGRSSHNFWSAHHDGAGWSSRTPLSAPGWGGRGRRIALAATADGMVCAHREPDGIAITRLDPARSGPEAENLAPSASPPSRPSSPRPPADILFGDLHQHTAHSDGLGTAEELYLLARTGRALDFAAVTDHDRFCRRAIGPATWRYLCDVANAEHDPGRFVTFCAYEMTGPRYPGFGHKCVYFADRVPERVPEKDVDTVFACLRELGGLCAPHHVAWTGMDAEHHDPEVQPVWEIFSVHGCYEHAGASAKFPPRQDCILPGQFVSDALEAGLRFGFIASTDSHGLLWHHGISPKRDPFSSGLAAVCGAERTRDSILDAIRARRTYATTGAKIRLRVELDGAGMGEALPADVRGDLGIDVEGTAAIQSITVVSRQTQRVLDASGKDRVEVRAPVARGDRLPWDYVYVRITQEDGEMAWSSPIWFGEPSR